MISVTPEILYKFKFAKCPFSIFTNNGKKLSRKKYNKYVRLPNLQLLISLFFATEKRKEGNRYNPAWKSGQDILSNVKPVECFLWLYFRGLGFMSMAANCWEGRENEYHLHSTARTFCGGDDDEGLIPVSDEADDMEAPA